MGCDGIVSTDPGIFPPHPLHCNTTRFEFSGPWNMSYSIGEHKANIFTGNRKPGSAGHGASVSIGATPPALLGHMPPHCSRMPIHNSQPDS